MSSRIPRALFLGAAFWAISACASASAVQAGERLSDWILRQPPDSRAYAPGLFWQVPAQRDEQAKLKYHLLALLALHEKAPSDSRKRLARMIESLPVTGRVIVPKTDPRWLQAHPDQDPILAYDHVVRLPPRPGIVSVIADDGGQCLLPHQPGLEARAYLNACRPDTANRVDHAWIIQPDGTVRQFGIARWNEQTQDEPAPGAHIWGPARDTGWSPRFSALLAEFLSTQDFVMATSVAAAQHLEIPAQAYRDQQRPARDGEISANDWGIVGLLQTPTARMSPAGEARFHYSRVQPYSRSNIILQPLDWLEAGFRYTNITNRLYGPEIAGDQTYKDKSFDVKAKLTKELAHLPQIAVGINDVGGTGLFSSEYVVASKRTGDFDWSLGIAWGYLAGSGNIGNPFSLFGKGFETRVGGAQSQQGGTINTQSFFHGPASLFGGVQYQSPSNKLLLKAEFDANDYQREPQTNNQKQSSHLNLGLVYRYHPSLDFTVGIERGNTIMFGLTFHGALDKMATPKLSDAPMVPVVPTRPTGEPNWTLTVAEIVDQSRWSVRRISREGGALHVVLEDPYGAYWNQRIERIAAILHRDAPADINRFVLTFIEHDIPMTERVILRDSWVKRRLSMQAMMERIDDMAAVEPRSGQLVGNTLWERSSDRAFAIGLVPHYQQNLGGPDGFLLYQAGVAAPMKLKLTEHIAITGRANLGVIDNYARYKYDGPSKLPRVRTSLREYQTSSALTLPNLQVTHVGSVTSNQFYSVYGGYLESMFAGVGGEWLYRPWQSHVAFGIDVNHVQQRDYKQHFGLRDYKVNTGHATLYWDTGWKSTHINFSAGRYLAGDVGGTVDISRTFRNGVSIGAWVTKTNVSAAQFGEGSFDKGIYVTIPFDVMMTSLSPANANLVWSPLTRDGGARLTRSYGLYGLTNPRDKRQTSFAPATALTPFQFDDDASQWVTEHHLFDDIGKSASTFASQVTSGRTGSALLLGSGMVLVSSLLDRPLARWADRHQTDNWNRLGKASTNVPILLAAGTGMLWWGLGGDLASDTAWTGIKAAAFTLAANTVARYAIGRARPDEGLGTGHFSPFGNDAAHSSLPSNHMGAAFALVTPFARQYDASWLYFVAGATAFGRIQQRQHFASDVVAGGLIGYGTGAFLSEQQRSERHLPRLAIGADRSINAVWNFR